MTPVVVSPRADADVDAMLEHLADLAGPTVARRYNQELDAVFERLAMFPVVARGVGPLAHTPASLSLRHTSLSTTTRTTRWSSFACSTAAGTLRASWCGNDRSARSSDAQRLGTCLRDLTRPSRRRWAPADRQCRSHVRHRRSATVLHGVRHALARQGDAPASAAWRYDDDERFDAAAVDDGVARSTHRLGRAQQSPPPLPRPSTKHPPSPPSITSSSARPTPSAPSPSMPGGSASICGSTAAIPNGARACCSSAAAISSSRSPMT